MQCFINESASSDPQTLYKLRFDYVTDFRLPKCNVCGLREQPIIYRPFGFPKNLGCELQSRYNLKDYHWNKSCTKFFVFFVF
jgi:hypothetical protein